MSIENWEQHTLLADSAMQENDHLRSMIHYQQAFSISESMIEDQRYIIQGVGGPVVPGTKPALWQFIVPAGYSGNGAIDIVLSTQGPITGFVLSGFVNTVVDPAFSAVDINTTALYPAFEKQTIPFGVTLVPGDIVTIKLDFLGQNGMNAWVRGLDFNYTINVL